MKRAKTNVGRPAKAAKGASPTRQHLQSEITTLQHEITTLKHAPAAAKKHKTSAKSKHGKKRGLALTPVDVACCAAEAVAESLRLALGVVATGDDVLELYFHTAGDPDEGASILATLHAAATFGLAGARPEFGLAPREQGPAGVGACRRPVLKPPLQRQFATRLTSVAPESGFSPAATCGGLPSVQVILGTELPGPHAVTVAPDGCWVSWGEHYDPADFPDAVVEEAWSVRWAA